MKKKYLFLLLFSIIDLINACECGTIGPFLKMINSDNIIISGQVLFIDSITYDKIKTPKSMKIKILKQYKGNIEKDTITINGGIGIDCRAILNTFKKDSLYILNLTLEQNSQDNFKYPYSISQCGEYWLKLVDDNVIGEISKMKTQIMTLAEFEKMLLKKGKVKEK